MAITALYAGLLAILYLIISARVITHRRKAQVEIGHGEDRELLRRMRVHSNNAEYIPIAVLLMALSESLAAPPLLLHATGIALLLGRAVHAYALSQSPHILNLRVAGMVLTLTTIGILAGIALTRSISAFI